MVGHVAQMGAKRNAHKILVGKPEGKIPLRRPRCRCVDNTKMDLRETGWSGMDWIDLVLHRDQWRVLMNTVMNFQVPQNAEMFLNSCTTGSFSRNV
jgi:hypothetical protein